MTKPLKIAVIPDTQVKPDIDLSWLEHIGNYIVEKQPDAIVHLGDFADMPSLSSYDKGRKSFEGRRYKKDIESVHEGMRTLLRPLYRYNDTHSRHKKKKYSPYMLMLGGNHECYDDKTEVLTENGWKLIKDVSYEQIYTFNENTRLGEWQYPTAKIEKPYTGTMLSYSSRTVDMCVTPGHYVFWETCSGSIKWAEAAYAPGCADVYVSATNAGGQSFMSDAQVRFCAVACTDASHHKDTVVFYQSEGKHTEIEGIIRAAGVQEVKHYVRDRDIKEICGKVLKKKPKVSHEYHMRRPEWCPAGNTRLPAFVYDLPAQQFELFLKTAVFCDGTIPTSGKNSLVFYGKRAICEDMQAACVTHGYRATITEYRENQWRVNITKTTRCRVDGWLKNEVQYDGIVYCLTVPNGTLLTRRNYKPVFSGNCRITRAIEDDPKLDGTIGLSDLKYEEFGWEVSPFLKVEQVGGICFSHYFVSGVMGRPITSAQALLTKKHVSCIAGHQQGKQIATATRGDGKRITGIITGSCLTPNHKVLTADLRYVELGKVSVGDKLVSFEEHPGTTHKSRRYKTGTVQAIKVEQDDVYEVTLRSGKVFTATGDHKWFVKTGSKYYWKETTTLRKGTRVPKLMPEWEASIMGTFRPKRLLHKFVPESLGIICSPRANDDFVEKVRYVGKQDVVRIAIDEKTMIVEGYGHHNCYPHDESYLGPQGNEHWRGMLMCYEVVDGQFDEGFISLNYLRSKYA